MASGKYKRAPARKSAIEAKRERNQALASVSREQTDKGFATLGILLALEALPKENGGNQRSAAAAEPALLRALFKQREKYTLQDHTDSVNKIRFSPTGSLAATASRDGTVRFWDTFTGKPDGVLKGHEDKIYSAEFSQDGSRYGHCVCR